MPQELPLRSLLPNKPNLLSLGFLARTAMLIHDKRTKKKVIFAFFIFVLPRFHGQCHPCPSHPKDTRVRTLVRTKFARALFSSSKLHPHIISSRYHVSPPNTSFSLRQGCMDRQTTTAHRLINWYPLMEAYVNMHSRHHYMHHPVHVDTNTTPSILSFIRINPTPT